jgi:hypothetical protein
MEPRIFLPCGLQVRERIFAPCRVTTVSLVRSNITPWNSSYLTPKIFVNKILRPTEKKIAAGRRLGEHAADAGRSGTREVARRRKTAGLAFQVHLWPSATAADERLFRGDNDRFLVLTNAAYRSAG